MRTYQPPFTITPTIIGLISEISENLGRLSVLGTIKTNSTPQDSPQVKRLLLALSAQSQAMNREELQIILKLKDRKSFRERYLKPALDNGLIEMTLPDKPNSRLQKYTLTAQGRVLAKS